MTRFLFAAAFLAAPAFAQGPITVTMAAPVAHDGAVQALATTWQCTGATCTGPEINARFGDPRACREIARAAGPVTAFASARGTLPADELARCNKAAKK